MDLLSIQAQRLLSDTCANKLNVADDVGLVAHVAAYVRSRNPSIVVVSQLSFRYTPPEKMVEAMHQSSPAVDGFYLVYPSGQANPCHYCSAKNVAAVLQGSRPAR